MAETALKDRVAELFEGSSPGTPEVKEHEGNVVRIAPDIEMVSEVVAARIADINLLYRDLETTLLPPLLNAVATFLRGNGIGKSDKDVAVICHGNFRVIRVPFFKTFRALKLISNFIRERKLPLECGSMFDLHEGKNLIYITWRPGFISP